MGHTLWSRLSEEAELAAPSLSGQPIVELTGDQRVLIENHMGVQGYGRERIVVKVRYGALILQGCDLKLARMTREQLVICGKIQEICIQRRERS